MPTLEPAPVRNISSKDTFAQEFTRLRRYFVTLAYNVLGVRQEAEDIVQDVFTGIWAMSELPNFANIKSYCTKAIINRALRRKQTMQREIADSYWGVWLPEPDVRSIAEFGQNEKIEERSISLGLLHLMETLTPSERAVYVLGELFEDPYPEIAQMLDLTEATARKQMQRAKEKLGDGKKRFSASRERHAELFQAFAQASQEGRYDELRSLLKEDVIMYSDGGGKVVASRIPIRGREKNILGLRNIAEWASKKEPSTWFPCIINGRIGAVARHLETGNIIAALTMEADDNGISELYSVRNPDKLLLLEQHFRLP
jgi:RNA polymerase sigma-70 factor, ECF subfamily